jgi:hypothetical protein
MRFQVAVSVYITSYLTGTMTSDQGIFLKFAMAFDFYRRFFIKYTVKKGSHFPVPSRDVTDQTLSGREKLNYSRPGRV